MKYVLVGGTLGILALGFVTCQSDETPASACPLPEAGSQQATIISDAEQRTRFKLDYPCYLPNAQKLESHSVTGNAGQQKSEFVFDGPFDIAVRQAQVPPPIEPDPTGATHTTIQLMEGVRADFIQRTDGSAKALYHLYWERNGFFYELQAFGPYAQQQTILQVARSLQPLP